MEGQHGGSFPYEVFLYIQEDREPVYRWFASMLDTLELRYQNYTFTGYDGMRAGIDEWVEVQAGYDDGFIEVGFSNASRLWPGTAQFARDAYRQLGRIVRWSPDEPHDQGDCMEVTTKASGGLSESRRRMPGAHGR